MFSTLLVAVLLSASAFAQQPVYGQCGGIGWTGSTTCVSGSVCVVMNEWYSQCIPGTATSVAQTTTFTTSAATASATTGLRIRLLPLGDSITYGVSSSSANGYRAALHTLLENGNTVDFIGSVKVGSMSDNDNEGHPGATIDQIANFAKTSAAYPSRPNVILVMAGTNDIFGGAISTGPNRLSSLIDQALTACPDAVVIVATLIAYPIGQSAVNTYNAAITTMVNNRTAAGQHVLLASMSSVLSSDLADGIHPNDAGYVKMANAWLPVIQKAATNGWIGTPM